MVKMLISGAGSFWGTISKVKTEILLLTVLGVLHMVGFAGTKAVGAQSNLEVTTNQAFVDFPESIDFRIQATSDTPIASIEIEYGVEMLTCGPVSAAFSPEFEPNTTVTLTWRWPLLEDTFIPPGSQVWWRWHLTDANGQSFTTAREAVLFLDSWFVWQDIADENISVHWYRGTRQMSEQVLSAAREAIDQLALETGLLLTDPIHIYLYDESFDLQASLPGAPAWAGGAAFPEHQIVMITANTDYLDYALATTRHEIGHLVIGLFTFNCTNGLPTWLNEGLAMVAEAEVDERAAGDLQTAVTDNRLLSLTQLEGSFSVHPDRAHLAYAQSYSMVNYLIETYGSDQMLKLLDTFRGGTTPDAALRATYNKDLRALENEWRLAIGAPPRPTSVDASTPTPVATLGLPTTSVPVVASPTAAQTAIPPTVTAVPSRDSISITPADTIAVVASTPTRIPLGATQEPASRPTSLAMPLLTVLAGCILIGAIFIFHSTRQRVKR